MRWMPMDKRDACGNAYDTQWREARKLYLQRHPLCVKCLEDKNPGDGSRWPTYPWRTTHSYDDAYLQNVLLSIHA